MTSVDEMLLMAVAGVLAFVSYVMWQGTRVQADMHRLHNVRIGLLERRLAALEARHGTGAEP